MRAKKQLKTFLNSISYNDEYFSRATVTALIRGLLEPVANQNTVSLVFTRLKNKDGLLGLIKRLEYCNNVEMIDLTVPQTLIKDDYIELEFIVFTSARYNFALIWDYSDDSNKSYTRLFFIINSKNVNDIYEIIQANMKDDYRERFYMHKPERRENELMNEAVFNVLKKLNSTAEESSFGDSSDFIVDLSDESNEEDKIKEIRHEIKNQLSILDVYSKLIEKKAGADKNFDVIRKSLSIINLSVNELGNWENHKIKELSLVDIIEEAVFMNDEVLKTNNNKFDCDFEHNFDLKIFADDTKLLSVFNNIIKNANESTSNDSIEINVKSEKNTAIVRIINHGSPIDSTSSKYLFDKGFTTKKKGNGVGLYFCKKYIEEIKGTIELEKSDNKETIFKIELPVLQAV